MISLITLEWHLFLRNRSWQQRRIFFFFHRDRTLSENFRRLSLRNRIVFHWSVFIVGEVSRQFRVTLDKVFVINIRQTLDIKGWGILFLEIIRDPLSDPRSILLVFPFKMILISFNLSEVNFFVEKELVLDLALHDILKQCLVKLFGPFIPRMFLNENDKFPILFLPQFYNIVLSHCLDFLREFFELIQSFCASSLVVDFLYDFV